MHHPARQNCHRKYSDVCRGDYRSPVKSSNYISISKLSHGYSRGGREVQQISFSVMGCLKESLQLHRAVSQRLSRLPYLPSPKRGILREANWTRIWCVRPVWSFTRTRDESAFSPSTRYSNEASFTPFRARLTTKLLFLRESLKRRSLKTPSFSSGAPFMTARYSFEKAR